MLAPPLRCAVFVFDDIVSPTREIIAVISSENLLDFGRTCPLTFPRLLYARKLDRWCGWSIMPPVQVPSIETQELGGHVIQMHGQLGEFKEP